MAGIDKIYGTEDQFIELKNWLTDHKPEALKHLYQEDYPNDWITRPISNFPEEIDMWLLDNCELDWVVSRIKEQCNKDFSRTSGQINITHDGYIFRVLGFNIIMEEEEYGWYIDKSGVRQKILRASAYGVIVRTKILNGYLVSLT